MLHQVGVERVVPGDEHRGRAPAAAPGPSRLLPQAGPGARPARDQHRVQAGDVDPQLERGGGGQPHQPPVADRGLQVPPVLGQVTGPVRGHLGLGRLVPAQRPARGQRDRLGAAPGPDEGQRRHVLADQPGQQVGGLRGRGAAQPGADLAARAGQRRLPQRERQRPARRAVLGDFLGVQPGQQPRTGSRRPDRRRGQHEHRPGGLPGRGVMRHDPAQPAQHVSHVRAEHPAVLVALVDDHVAQPAEEPGPAGVPGKQRLMQHVRRGQQVPGVTAGPVALGPGRVAVERGGLDPGQAQGADRGQLVGGQRLGRRHVQHGLAGQHRGQRGQQVAERLAGRRAGGDDHVPAGLRVAGGLGLMGPGGPDAAACEGTGNLGGNPRRPRHLAPGPGRDVLHVHGSPRPRVVQQDAQRPVLRRAGRLSLGSGGLGGRIRLGEGGDGGHSFLSVSPVGGCSEA